MDGLTRKFLTSIGIDESKHDLLIERHTSVVNALKEERDSYKADAEKLETTKTELTNTKNELNELKKAQAGENPFEKKYNELKGEYDKYKADISAKEVKASKEGAYRKLLKEIGVADKRIDSVMRVTDIDKIELDKDGNIKDKDNLTNKAKTEWADFIPSTHTQGANTPTPPANSGGAKKTKEEIDAIKDTNERIKAIAENHELYNF